MDHDTLARHVREALEHIHNRGYLAIHPLASFLGEAGRPRSGEATRRDLLEAIEQLRPLAGTAATEADWRRYHHLVLRHLEGRSLDEVARALGVSVRQASRDYQQAIAAIAALLLVRHRGAVAAAIPRGDSAAPPSAASPPAETPGEEQASEPSPLTTRDQPSEERSTSLADALSGVLLTLERLAPSHRTSFVPRVPDTLPPVAMSRTMLRQALLNLLMYAAAAAPGAEILLVATDTVRGVALRIVPREVGGGASRPTKPTISTEASELLATGRQILETQGGSVEVGSTGDASAGAPDYLLRLLLPPVQLGKILVIDDNPDLVGLFRRYLRDEPYRVIQATTAASALRLAAELRPDAIILDVVLPSQDGWDVLQQLRDDPLVGSIPVVVCSVLPERALARSLGVADFLAKPVTKASLLAALERCGAARTAREAARRAPP